MAKYIDIKMTLEKTMKVNNDDLQEALKIAEDEYPMLELTPEWFDARDVTISENPIISSVAERIADLSHENFDKESIHETLDLIFGKSEIRDYIYDEAMEVLKNKYHVDIDDIDI